MSGTKITIIMLIVLVPVVCLTIMLCTLYSRNYELQDRVTSLEAKIEGKGKEIDKLEKQLTADEQGAVDEFIRIRNRLLEEGIKYPDATGKIWPDYKDEEYRQLFMYYSGYDSNIAR